MQHSLEGEEPVYRETRKTVSVIWLSDEGPGQGDPSEVFHRHMKSSS